MVTGAWMAFAQGTAGGPKLVPGVAPPKAPAPIATVATRSVSRDEFSAREKQAMSDYRQRLGQDVPEDLKPALRRQLLESLIRRELLVLEAQRRGVTATDEEAAAELRKDPFFNPNGQFDPQRYEVVRTTQPENYKNAIASIKLQLGARALNQRLEQEFVGNDPALRARSMRGLTRADVQVLPLRRQDYVGTYREPREIEIVDWYRSHLEDYRRIAKATLTVLQVDQPPLADGVTLDSPAGREWRSRMRTRADSALAAARGGAVLEDLSRVCGSIRHSVDVTPDNFPGFWQGDARDRAAVFETIPGGFLASPVGGTPGWLVVRVDSSHPSRIAPLVEVATEIRNRLRADAKLHGDDRELMKRYTSQGSSLREVAWKLRYATFDSSLSVAAEPTPAELDRWYRAHQADFSAFDAAAGKITVKPLDSVRDEAIARWKMEQRATGTRLAAAAVEDAWRRGQRDRNAERAATLVREVGPVVPGAAVDTGRAARAIGDSLRINGLSLRTGRVSWAHGWAVFQVYEKVANFMPPFEQVRPTLAADWQREVDAADEKAAQAIYDKDPSAFATGQAVYYTRVMLERPDPIGVRLTRAEVEAFHRQHIDRYSAPEVIRARHIMIALSGAGENANEEAKARAQTVLDRARRGEDFADLARRYSDDVATREKGGDLGTFSHGAMLGAFEDAAFKLKAGEISGLVRTEVGWHIIKCEAHDPIYSEPLKYVYANVGWDAALEKAESLVVHRADSLVAAVRTPQEAQAAAARLKLSLDHTFHLMGDRKGLGDYVSFLIRLEHTPPGKMVQGRAFDRGAGHFIAWVDSVAAARNPSWEDAKPFAIRLYRGQAGDRALKAKRAELDSLAASGWSLDSLATLQGGWQRTAEAAPGAGLSGMGSPDVTDSLVFGSGTASPVLAAGQTSEWVETGGGWCRVRVLKRTEPDPSRLAAQLEGDRRLQFERKLYVYFEDLKKRYPVKILDTKLRDTPLPPPPAAKN
jgi:parvulin-like peptidyl-prolyl isomerase